MLEHAKAIILEGLIGVGKSACARELGAALQEVSDHPALVLIEPSTAAEGQHNPYLADYYRDPARYALEMQLHLLQERFRMHLRAQSYAQAGEGHAVVDRSWFGDVAFLEVQRHLHFVDDRGYRTYRRLYEVMTGFVRLPSVCVRLVADPEMCQRRIADRLSKIAGRQCEAGVSVEYLSLLDDELTHVLRALAAGGVHVLTMCWDQERPDARARDEAVRALAGAIHRLPAGVSPRELHLRRMG